MNSDIGAPGGAEPRLEFLSNGLCKRIRAGRAIEGRLLIRHPSVRPEREPVWGSGENAMAGPSIRLAAGMNAAAKVDRAVMECETAELPFTDGAFRSVTLYHVLADGTEPELGEACRVLASDGDLLVVGLNHCGWSGFDAGYRPELPRLRPGAVRRRLLEFDVVLHARYGAGFLGRPHPADMGRGAWRLALPAADIVLLHARHVRPMGMARPRLKDVPAGWAPTALAGR
ncbi:hypothetical protein [Elongatibacter sediminis]|uniref:Methyltransferase type 11 domain-containing protein n=1 Tax=Elongatibacter sediminis TaxID=3119006 RepID=A0AAW9RC56_9GAMM